MTQTEKNKKYLPSREEVDSWATRVGALAVISALISLSFGDEVPVTDQIAQGFVNLTKLFLLAFAIAPLLSIMRETYSERYRNRPGVAFGHQVFSWSAFAVTFFAAFPSLSLFSKHFILSIVILTIIILVCFLPYLVLINRKDASVPPTTE